MNVADVFGANALVGFECLQLGHELAQSMPQAGHASYRYELLSGHGDGGSVPGADSAFTVAIDRVDMGLHAGTHIDSLNHVAENGLVHGDVRAEDEASAESLGALGRPLLSPLVARAALLDFPAFFGTDRLPQDYAITAEDMLGCAERFGLGIDRGNVILVRTGWDTLWDSAEYLALPNPGVALSAARLLRERGVVATGADTMAYEQAPGDDPLHVHVELLVRGGIHILENLDLRELSRRRAYCFGFVAAPLRFAHGTGSPINPLAFVPTETKGSDQ